jgi:hypothetical protein
MTQSNMPNDEQYDCADVLHKFRDIIQRAWIDDLPTNFSTETPEYKREKERFETFLCLGLLDEEGKMKVKFHKVVSEVIGNRIIGDLTYSDYEVIASRYREWYPHDRLDSQWHKAVAFVRGEPH